MGAVNYFTSDYITLGVKPYESDDFEADPGFVQEMEVNISLTGETREEYIRNYISECYQDDLINVETELENHDFYYYHVAIKPGYYEGFTIDIENNFLSLSVHGKTNGKPKKKSRK